MRIDRFLFKEILVSSSVGSIVALAVLIGLQVLRLSEIIVRYDLGFTEIASMMMGLALSFTPLVFPIAFLFALLSLFGRMSSDKEWVAMLSMGVSPLRALRAPLFAAGLVCLATFLTSSYFGPKGNQEFEMSIDQAFKKRLTSVLRSGTFSEGFLDLVVFVDRINPTNQKLERVFIYDESNFNEDVSISASEGEWIQATEVSGLATLKLKDGILVSQNPEKKIVKRVVFDEYRINADFSKQVGVARNSPPSLSLTELVKKRREHRAKPEFDGRPYWVEIGRRMALAFAALFFVPLALTFGIDNSRTAKSRSVFTGLVILFSYWTVYFAALTWVLKTNSAWVVQSEAMSWLAVWVPNLIVGLIGFFGLRRHLHP